MEVKEIIEYLEKHKPIPLFARSKEDYNEYIGKDIEKIDKMITLLKELEAENKRLKQENKALRKDKWELEGINEACRKENEAYREMWEESKKRFFSCEIVEVAEIINKLEQEYLGGGE